RCLVPELGSYLWRSPPSTSCPGKICWLLLWGVLQSYPTQGSMTSPGYPKPYLKGQESSTEAPEGFTVRLVFQDFDLEPFPEGDSVTISASRMDLSQLCGKQGSSLGSPPGQGEFVSTGRRFRLTFRAHTSSKDKTTHLHKGFLVLFQAVVVSCSQPINQASGGSEPIIAPGANSSKIHRHSISICLTPTQRPTKGHSAAHPGGPGRTDRMGWRFLSVYLSVDSQSPPLPRTQRSWVLPKLNWATSPGKPSPASMDVGAGPYWATNGSSLLPTPSSLRTASASGRTGA
uniref:Complement C1r subcomponent like n=1 Tax=Urocitellus parryii TaxID=9999 RepID=A0A8D2KHT5_UROPR